MMGFHETRAFFAIWGLFIFASSQLACIDYIKQDNNDYRWFLIPASGMYTLLHSTNKSYTHVMFSILTCSSVVLSIYRSDWFIRWYYNVLIHLMCWGVAAKRCDYESSKTHFPFFGVGSNIGYLLLSTTMYFDKKYGLMITDNTVLIISVLCGGLSIFIGGITQEYETDSDEGSKRPALKNSIIYFISGLVFIESYLCESTGNYSMPDGLSNAIYQVQFGKVGIALACSAVASFIFKSTDWRTTAIASPMFHLLLYAFDKSVNKYADVTRYGRTFISFLLFDPSKEMINARFSKTLRWKPIPDVLIRSFAMILGNYAYHESVIIPLLMVWCALIYFTDKQISKELETNCEERLHTVDLIQI